MAMALWMFDERAKRPGDDDLLNVFQAHAFGVQQGGQTGLDGALGKQDLVDVAVWVRAISRPDPLADAGARTNSGP